MNSRGNTLKLTAVSALVVLTLTGFSTGRGHGGGSGDGGGCSSSGQNHDSSSSSGGGSHRDYDDDDDYGSGSGAGGGEESASASGQDADVELVDCASEETPYATVEVTNRNAVDGVFTVTVRFEDATGAEVVTRSQDVAVPGGETVPARVNVGTDADVTQVTECEPEMYAPAAA